ncbi:MAG: carboxylesterase family protein [Sphingomonadales bacterium]|nr:carboxylesterase family protein [Sphingomonadales bacterium]MDE2170899.1 carboxylesterase family protein [Sphingomonadales bacterium]
MRRRTVCGLAAMGLMGASPPSPLSAPLVEVTQGVLSGTVASSGALLFRAIPFAAPPLGTLRWRPPAPAPTWPGIRDATRRGAPCLQNDYGWNHADYVRANEDCLTLDVATPALSGKRPVMVWIHGGSNRAGSAGDTVLSSLVSKGVVLVALQYRLGIFGFLSHRALAHEQGGASGNYGLMDQIAALRWVRANIARFGGDPTNVTIFGESAGGQDVGLLLASPMTRELFARAILQSGTPQFGLPARPLDLALRLGNQLDALLGTGGEIDRLREASPHALLEADKALHDEALESDDFLWLRATQDGAVLPGAPQVLLRSAPPRPVIIGSNRAEFDLPGGRPHRDANVAMAFGANAVLARAFYHLDEPDPPADARMGSRDLRISTDILFRCPSGHLADLLSSAGWPVWRYELDLGPQGARSFHGSDLPYVLGGTLFGQQNLSLQDYWLAFATSGDPDAGKPLRPHWGAYAPAHHHVTFAAAGMTAGARLADTPCQWSLYP